MPTPEEDNKKHMYHSLHLRQSPVILVLKFIILELTIFIIHSLIKVLLLQVETHLGSDLYSTIGIIEIILIQIINIFLIFQIVFAWLSTTYTLNPREVILSHGLISRVSTTYEFANLQSMTINQSFWGRIFKFGSIRLFNPVLKEEVILDLIPNPDEVGLYIQQFQPEITPILRRQKS